MCVPNSKLAFVILLTGPTNWAVTEAGPNKSKHLKKMAAIIFHEAGQLAAYEVLPFPSANPIRGRRENT